MVMFQNTGAGATTMLPMFLRMAPGRYHWPSGTCVAMSKARFCAAMPSSFCLAGSV